MYRYFKYAALGLIINFSYGLTLQIPPSLKSNVSVSILDSDNGDSIYSYNSSTPRLIASNVKLFTTMFGLTYLGPDFHWHTQLKYNGTIRNHILNGNLYLQGGGDPSLGSSAVYEIMSNLKRLGINKIAGKIILDSNLFNNPPTYSMLQTSQYDVDKILPSGLIINGNRAKFTMHITHNKIAINNNLYNIKVNNQLKLESGDNLCSMDDTVSPGFSNNIVSLNGSISKSCDGKDISFFVLNNFEYNKMVLNQVLTDLSIEGQPFSGTTPQTAKLIYDHSSPSLTHIIYDMNKTSNNLYAETIISSVGAYKTTNQQTFNNGAAIYYKFLKSNNLYIPQFKLENGAGLSRYEFLTADAVAHLLYIANNSIMGANIEASLPVAMQEGTLYNKFPDFSGRLLAKTGSLNDTRAYSGYFYSKNEHKYIVVFIANNLIQPKQKELFTDMINQTLGSLDQINN